MEPIPTGEKIHRSDASQSLPTLFDEIKCPKLIENFTSIHRNDLANHLYEINRVYKLYLQKPEYCKNSCFHCKKVFLPWSRQLKLEIEYCIGCYKKLHETFI
jgi:hypothetical protein